VVFLVYNTTPMGPTLEFVDGIPPIDETGARAEFGPSYITRTSARIPTLTSTGLLVYDTSLMGPTLEVVDGITPVAESGAGTS